MGIITTFKQASEVIARNQVAVVVFTHGEHFNYDSSGSGFTGKWVVDPDMLEEVDKVIIYLRREGENVNRIYLGNYAGTRPSDIPRRQVIRFSALKEIGTTESNWLDFAGGGQNPVCYVSG
jgi:hypothetical protein